MALKSRTDFISEQRAATRDLITALNKMVSLKRQYDALNLGNATTGLLQPDFVDQNSEIVVADFKAAVNACLELNTAFTLGATIAANLDKKLYLIT